jgi:hypothetical protein
LDVTTDEFRGDALQASSPACSGPHAGIDAVKPYSAE